MFFEYLKNFSDYKLFSVAHILFFIVALLVSIALAILLRNKTAKTKRTVLIVCALSLLSLYYLTQMWRVWAYADGRSKGILDKVAYLLMPNEVLPFQLCSMVCFLVPLAVFTKKQLLLNAVAPLCIIGGFLFFFYPDGILNRYPAYSFRVLESVLLHTVLLFFGIYCYTAKLATLNMKTVWQPFAMMGCVGVLAIAANIIFAPTDSLVNFLYLRLDVFGIGLPTVVTTLIMAAVFTGVLFAILGIIKLCSLLSQSRTADKDKLSETRDSELS